MEHWSLQTRRLQELQEMGRLDEHASLLAIAVELADLRKALTSTGVEVRENQFTELVDELLGVRTINREKTLEDVHEGSDLAAIPSDAVLRQVGWYCAGGHDLPSKMHSGQSTLAPAEPDLVVANMRFDDPCEFGVPAYVLVTAPQ